MDLMVQDCLRAGNSAKAVNDSRCITSRPSLEAPTSTWTYCGAVTKSFKRVLCVLV